jgi:hypothetical protein
MALSDSQIRDWLRKEETLKVFGEWRAAPDIDMVLTEVDIQANLNKYQIGGSDLVILPCARTPSLLYLPPITQYLDQELTWQPQYQNIKGAKRADLHPARGGPAIAIMEVPESSMGTAVAQVGQQGFIIYEPDQLPAPFDSVIDLPPDAATLKGRTVTFGDGRIFRWQLSHVLYNTRSFTTKSGALAVTFYHDKLRIAPNISPDVIPALILMEYYMYSAPVIEDEV